MVTCTAYIQYTVCKDKKAVLVTGGGGGGGGGGVAAEVDMARIGT